MGSPGQATVKVLHCIDTLGGGGAERQLGYLVQLMQKRGIDTHVSYLIEGPNKALIQGSSAGTHQLPNRRKFDPRILVDLSRLIVELKPDIVHTWLTKMDIVAGLAALWQRTPVVLAERSSKRMYPLTLRNILRGVIGKRAEVVVTNSRGGASYWIQRGFKREIVVIRNGVPFNRIRAATPCSTLRTESLNITLHNSKLILFAGRYDAGKNILTLLNALSIALEHQENAIAVLFGHGPMDNEMRNFHRRLPNRDRIHVLGYTESLSGYMRRADLFVSLSTFEGNPNVVLEAIAAGCPLVLSAIPEHEEIVDANSAVLVPPDDARAAADAIVSLLENPREAASRAQRAMQCISEWSIESAVEQHIEVYKKVLS